MAEYLTEKVYVGFDNAIELELTDDGAAVALASVTRVVLNLGAALLDSDTDSGVFDWSSGSLLVMKLGNATGIESLVGTHSARLIVYTALETNGVVWLDPIIIRIIGPLV